jgi:hypothetical protein
MMHRRQIPAMEWPWWSKLVHRPDEQAGRFVVNAGVNDSEESHGTEL